MKKQWFAWLAAGIVVLAVSSAWAQTRVVLDTGVPYERVCNPKSYTDLGNGIVRDNVTGLEWLQASNLIASKDPDFDNDGTAGDGMVTWQHALDYIELLNSENYLGCGDWRLPTSAELSTLVDFGRVDPSINTVFMRLGSSTGPLLPTSTIPTLHGMSIFTAATCTADLRANSCTCVLCGADRMSHWATLLLAATAR